MHFILRRIDLKSAARFDESHNAKIVDHGDQTFGRLGRANGLGAMAAIPLLAGASALSHLLEGWTGSYATGFLVQIGLLFTGGLLLSLVTFPKHESEPA